MPISNASKSTSPLAYPGTTVPDYNFSNRPYEPIGSKDTFLSQSGLFGWGSTYYDKGFSPYRSQVDQRYYNQSAITWLGNSAASIGLKTFATGIPSVAGSLTSLAASPLAAFSDSLTQADIYSKNPLNQLASAIDAQINDLAYLPTREDFNSLDFVRSLARPTELISQNVDSLAFLAQSFAGAGLLGKLNIGARLAPKLAKFSPLYEELTSLKAPNIAGMADKINAITTNAVLTTNEAALEAKDASTQLNERLHQGRLNGENNLTDEEIKQRVDKAAYNVFWQNVATGAILNIPFVNLMKTFSPTQEISTRANEYGLRLLGNKIKAPEYLNKFEKFFFDKGYAPGVFAKSLIEQTFSEGLEEALQQSIQNVNQLDDVPNDFFSSSKRYLSEIVSGETLDLSNRDRGMAFGLGALMGGSSTVLASAFKRGPVGEARTFAKNRDKYVESLNSSYSTLFNNSIVSKEADVTTKLFSTTTDGQTKYYAETPDAKTELSKDEYTQLAQSKQIDPNTGGSFVTPGKIQLDDNGQPIVNPNKIAKLAADAVVFDELSDLISREMLGANPDELKLKLLRHETVAKAALNYLDAGAFDIFLDRLEALQKDATTHAAELGIVDPNKAATELGSVIDFAKELETLYLTTKNSTPIISSSKANLELNERRKQDLFHKGQRLLTLDTLIKDVQTQINGVKATLAPKFGQDFVDTAEKLANQKFSEATTELLNEVDISTLSNKELASLPEFQDAERIASDPEGRQLLDLAIKDRTLRESRRELGKVFDSLLKPKEGFKLFQKTNGDIPTSSTLRELRVDSRLTAEHYNAYELRQVKSLQLENKFSLAAQQFYSEYLHEFFKYFNPEDTPFDKATQTRQIVQRILEKKPYLHEEDARALIGLIEQQVSSYESLEATLRAQASQNDIDYDDKYIVFEDDLDKQQAILDEISKANEIKDALGMLLDPDTPAKILALTQPLSVPTELQLRRAVAAKLVQPAQTIIELSKFDGENIDEGYTNLASVITELNKLELLNDKVFSKLPHLSDYVTISNELIDALKKIRIKIEANLMNREAQAKQQNVFYAQAVLDSFELPDDIKQLAQTDPVGAAMLFQDQNTVDEALLAQVEEEAKQLLSAVVVPTTMFGAVPATAIENVTRSPIRGMRYYLTLLNSRVGDIAIAKFLDDFNIIDFITTFSDAAHPSVLSLQDRLSIIEAYKKVLAVRAIKLYKGSTLTHLQIQKQLQTNIAAAKRNRDAGNTAIPAPSAAQERVITELAFFLSSKKQLSSARGQNFVAQFQNVAALKAPPGAGKSVLVTPLTFSVLGYTPDNILTAANHQPAADVIKSSTNSSYPAHTHDELLRRLSSNNIPAEVKVIVLDEAGSMNPEDLYKVVGAFTEFLNQNQDRNVKMLLIYDPNQVNRSAWGVPRLEQEAYSIPVGYTSTTDPNELLRYETGQKPLAGSEMPWIQNITDITPLSSTYRSDVGEIIDLINLFTASDKVTSISTASITDPLTNQKDNLGTYSEQSPTNLLRILKNSVTANPNRSFAVIVGTESKRTAYIQDLQNAGISVPVYTVEESSGITVDEAYVDLEYRDDPRFTPYPKLYNQYLRTALSRARKFAYLSGYATNHTLDPHILDKAQLNQRLNESRYDTALAEKAATIALLSNTQAPNMQPTTTAPTATAQVEDVDDEEVVEAATPPLEENAEIVLPILDGIQLHETPPSMPVADGAFTAVEPQSEAFNEIGSFAPIKAGDEVIVVKQVTGDKSRYVIAKVVGPNLLRMVGVVSDANLAAFKQRFDPAQIAPETSLTADILADTSGRNIFTTSVPTAQLSQIKLKIAEGSADIQYHYSANTTADFKNAGVPDLLSRWASSMFRDPQAQLQNYEDLVQNWDKYVSFRIFRKAQEVQRMFPSIANPDSLLHKPLMVIHNVRTVTGNKMAPQFIELRPAVLSQQSEVAKQIGLPHIYDFMNTLNEFVTLVSKHQWPTGVYNNMDLGMSIKLSESDIYYPFHKFVQSLAKSEAGKPIIVASNDLKERLRAVDQALVLEDIDPATVNPKIIELAKKLYDLVHEGGEAQAAFNALASTNLMVTLPSGKTKILRDYTTNVLERQGSKVTRSHDVMGGLSLLGPLTFEHNKGRSYNPLIKQPLLNTLGSYLQRAYQRRTGINIPLEQILTRSDLNTREKFVASILIDSNNPSTAVHLAPLTSEDLKQIFVDSVDSQGKFTGISEGFGLRSPLSLFAFSDKFTSKADQNGRTRTARDLSLYSFVETSFLGVTPTTIGLVEPASVAEVPSPVIPIETVAPNDLTTVRQMHDDGYSTEEIVQALPHLDAQYVANYTAQLGQQSTYNTRITAITKLVANQMRSTGSSPQSKLEDIFFESKYAKDFEKTGSRDYVRAAILALVLPELYQDRPFEVIDQARSFVRSAEDFAQANDWLRDAATAYGISEEALEQRIASLNKTAAAVAAKYKLPFNTSNGYQAIQDIVALSSGFRTLEREGRLSAATDTQVDTGTLVLEQLRDAVLAADFNKFRQITASEEFQGLPLDLDLSDVSSQEDLENSPQLVRQINQALTELGIERSMRIGNENEDVGEELTDEEVRRTVSRITPPNLHSFLKRLFNSKENTEVFRIVSQLYMQYRLGRNNWGLYKNGLIYLSRTDSGKVGIKVVTHEMFHRIFHNYLTREEQIRALDLARDKYGNLPIIELEEKLATEFSNFNPKRRSLLSRIFNRILRFLNFSYNNMKTLEDFFESISSGYYTGEGRSVIDTERNYPILREFGTIENYLIAKRVFLDTFEQIYNSGREGTPLSYDEAVSQTLDSIKAYVSNPTHTFGLEEESTVISAALAKLLAKNGKAARFFIESFFYATDVAKVVELKKQQRAALREDVNATKARLELLEAKMENEGSLSEEELEEVEALNVDVMEGEKLLQEETFEAELQDPRSKLTSRVKQRLVSIKYSDSGKVKYAEFGKAYNVLIQLVSQADTSSLANFKESVRQRISSIGKSIVADATGYHTSIRRAVAAFMLNTIGSIERQDAARLKNVAFFRDANYEEEYIVLSLDGSDVHSITKSEAQKHPDRYQVVPRIKGQSLNDFISFVADTYSINKAGIVNNYYLFEDLNFLRSLIAATTSLRKANPYTAREVYRNYRYRAFYSGARKGGTSAATESQLSYAFAEHVNSLPANSKLFPTSITDGLQTAKTKDDKRAVLSQFVRLLQFRGIPQDATEEDIVRAFSQLQRAIPALEASAFKVDPVEAFSDEASLVDSLVTLLGTSGSYVDITSYIRGDGKRAYTWVDASFQSALLQAFNNPLSTTTFEHLKIDKGRLTTEAPILKDNIYVNNNLPAAQILGYVDHDAIRKVHISRYLYSETLEEFHQRNFIFGFLANVSKGNYVQFLPVPSERRSIQGVRVKTLSKADAIKAIQQILQAQENRPAAEGPYGNVVRYGKNRSKITFAATSVEDAAALVAHGTKQAIADMRRLLVSSTGSARIDDLQVERAAAALGVTVKGFTSNARFSERLTDLNKKKKAAKTVEDAAAIEEQIEALKSQRSELLYQQLEPLFEIFYYNYIVNNYSLSQLIYGDETFYNSKEDVTKRIKIATATGDALLVDSAYGIPEKTYVGVIEDLEPTISLDLHGISPASYRQTFKETDAQGYMLPEAYELYARTYGIESDLDVTMKPVYFGIDKYGVPRSIKYSAIVLTDELVAQYPHLGNLRDKMRKGVNGKRIDQAVFRSAVKMGAPLQGLSPAAAVAAEGDFEAGHVMETDSKFYRIQLNPSKDPDVTVSNPSQITAFMNTNGLNTAEISELHRLNAMVISLGAKGLSRELQLSEKGTLTKGSFNTLRKRLVTTLERIAGSEDVAEALSSVDENGRPAVSFDLPLIQEKVVASIASIASASTVSFRFPGSKLVLQSPFGTLTTEKLQYKDKDGYTEVMLPETYRAFFSEGSTFTLGNKDGIVGFRIPSTNYHSALALKVVGFYPVPAGSSGNIIIAPAEIVFFHGSDYDIDTLFLIRKKASAQDVDLTSILAQYFRDVPQLPTIEKGEVVGVAADGSPLMVQDTTLHDYLNKVAAQIDARIRNARREYIATTDLERRRALAEGLANMEEDFYTLLDVAMTSAQNNIVYLLSSNLREERNRKDLLTPISFERVSSSITTAKADLAQALEDESFINELVSLEIIKQECQ